MAGPSLTEASAATSQVPAAQIVSIQHPCIIKNFQSGFRSLGGEQQLKHVLENDIGDSKDSDVKGGVEPEAGVSLRPNDPFAKKLVSEGEHTGNILIKVTLPKRTGRKRKRGSTAPYHESHSGGNHAAPESITSTDLLRRLQDNAKSYTMEAVGVITDTHRFNTLPDFQTRVDEVPVMREIRDHAMTPDYDRLKAFDPVTAQHSTDSQSSPFPGPPAFLPMTRNSLRYTMPPQKTYQPKSKFRLKKDYTSIPKAARADRAPGAAPPPQLRDLVVKSTSPTYPLGPKPGLPPKEAIETIVATIIRKLERALAARPIYARLAYGSLLAGHRDTNVRHSLPHVAFYLDMGPWRKTVVRYGVDPRKDPKHRIYQTVSFSKTAFAGIKAGPAYDEPDRHVRVFDGTRVVDPAEMWQLCDFTQPLLRRLVHDSPVRPACDGKLGWYFNGTVAKIIVIARDMMMQLADPDREGRLTEQDYEVLAALPDEVAKARQCYLGLEHGERLARLAEAIGDEAVMPTYLGIRGYEEVFAVKRFEETAGGAEERAERTVLRSRAGGGGSRGSGASLAAGGDGSDAMDDEDEAVNAAYDQTIEEEEADAPHADADGDTHEGVAVQAYQPMDDNNNAEREDSDEANPAAETPWNNEPLDIEEAAHNNRPDLDDEPFDSSLV